MRFFSPGLVLAATALCLPALAQQEFALTVGGFNGPIRTAGSKEAVAYKVGVAVEGNYGRYIRSYKHADLYGEVHLLFSPHQGVTATLTSVTDNFMSLYVTPGVKFKFYPKK